MRRRLTSSFGYAFEGIKYVLKTQPNMKIHSVKLSEAEWLAIVIVIGFVLILEVVNTAVETLVDLYTEEYHHLAKVSKDTAAGAVLLMAIVSVVVGLIIFLPKIWDMIAPLIFK